MEEILKHRAAQTLAESPLVFNHVHAVILLRSSRLERSHFSNMLLSRGDGNHHDPQRAPFALQATDLSSSISRAQGLMRDGRHVDAASLLSQHRWRQDMAAAEASMIVHMLCECAQRCAGRSQDIVVLGIQMCRDAQTVAEGTGLAPQQLLPVLLVRPPSSTRTHHIVLFGALPTLSPSLSLSPHPSLLARLGARAAAAFPRLVLRSNRHVSARVLLRQELRVLSAIGNHPLINPLTLVVILQSNYFSIVHFSVALFVLSSLLDRCPQHALMLASALRQSGQSRDAMSHASAAVQVTHAAPLHGLSRACDTRWSRSV